jgi:hypothetical protein
MSIKIGHDPGTPTAAVELMIARALPDYDIEDVAKSIPRDVDMILVSQGFKDLVDDARAFLDRVLPQSGLELVQLTGAICADGEVFRPGLWIILRDSEAAENQEISPAAARWVNAIAEDLRTNFKLSGE